MGEAPVSQAPTSFGRRLTLHAVAASRAADGRVQIAVGEIRNTTHESASAVSVAVWTTREPYQGGSLKGVRRGTFDVGRIAGGATCRGLTWTVDVADTAAHLAILLLEGTSEADSTKWHLHDYAALGVPAKGAAAAPADPVIEESDLIGQARAKAALNQVIAVARLNEERRRRGLPATPVNFHSAFIGSPGTGKTTFARFYTQQIRGLGLLPRGHLVEVSRADLVAEYVGQTAARTAKVIESALGGVLFIDEAYALKQGKDDGFGQECIDTIVKEMEDHREELVVIFAGYSAEMRDFLRQNSGLESRVPHVIEFEDFDDEALGAILDAFCRQRAVTLAPGVRSYAVEQVAAGRRGRSFGNARDVRNLVERAVANQSVRLARRPDLATVSHEELSELWYSDFLVASSAEVREPPSRRAGTADALARLHTLVGLANVKRDVRELVGLIRIERARRPGQALPPIALHRLYAGPMGCGKRTVARHVGSLLYELGLLARGHLIEVSRADLVAGYIGQTSIKTRARVEEAMGGILFVQNAAALWQSKNGFEGEAVDALLDAAETYRDRMVVVLADTPAALTFVVQGDPRVTTIFGAPLVFDTASVDDLLEIASRLVQLRGLRLTGAASERLRTQLEAARRGRDAVVTSRDVGLALEQAYRVHALRLEQLGEPANLDAELLHVLEADDFSSPAGV